MTPVKGHKRLEIKVCYRTVENVEFVVYDGIHFPVMPYLYNVIVSVWVLQYMEKERLKKSISELARYLKPGGKVCLIEQASDNRKVGRPKVEEYLESFRESNLECFRYYPIRNGRWWMLYLIRYGLVPKGWLHQIARYELEKRRKEAGFIRFYKDFLFVLRGR